MANYSSNANGNWSDSTKWTPNGVPGNGDCVSIGHNIVIDQNIGTAGNGIRNIRVTAGNLTVSNAAARTIIFASTGTDPIGSGSAANPDCATATMFGFFNSYGGTINIVGTSSNKVTITTGNGTSPWYLYNQNAGANFAFQYVNALHMGTASTNFRGLEVGTGYQNFSVAIDHCKFEDCYQIILLGIDDTDYDINFNFFTGGRASGTDGHISGAGRAAPSLSISDNTLTNPINNAYFIILNALPNGSLIERNALWGTSTAAISLGLFASGTGHSYKNNLVVNTKSSSGLAGVLAQTSSSTVESNYLSGMYSSGIDFNNTSGLEIFGNFIANEEYAWFGQGGIFAGGADTADIHNNVIVNETANLTNASLGMLLWDTTTNSHVVDHNTFVGPPQINGGARGFSSLAVSFGEPGASGTGNIFRNNLMCGWVSGYADDANVAYASDFASVGMHHSGFYDNTFDFFTTSGQGNGEANFWNGTNAHPSPVYGEVPLSSSPRFIDTLRRIPKWDSTLGGPGTIANVFDQMSRRSGFGGTYNTLYTVAALVLYVLGGFMPQNSDLRTAASDSLTIGAVEFSQATTTKTQTGLARINKQVNKTQSGVSRVRKSSIKTQIGKAFIQGKVSKTQTGVARISSSTVATTRTQAGRSRVRVRVTKVQTGKAAIRKSSTRTQTGKSKINVASVRTQTGKATLRKVTARTQTGSAFIVNSVVGPRLIIGSSSYIPLDSSFRITKTLSAAWSASCDIWYSGGPKPTPGQHVSFFIDGVLRFGGLVLAPEEEGVPGRPVNSILHLQFTGFQSFADRAIVALLFTPVMGGTIGITFYEIWRLYLQAQFGVTKTGNAGPSVTLGNQLFHYVTVTEVFNQLRDQSPGWDWWIDDNKELFFRDTTPTTPSAPFTIRDGDANADTMIVSRSNARFRNKQWVLPAADILELWTDTHTALAGQTSFATQYVLTVAPTVTVDGVEQTVTEGSGACYYVLNGTGVFFSAPPGVGKVIAISYTNPWPMAYSAQDDASIAAVGLYESVYQSKNIIDADTARAFAQGLLDLYGTSGDFPEKITFSYNSERQAAWLTPGMIIDVIKTFPTASGNFTVEEVSSEEQSCVWRHNVTLRAGLGEVNESQLLEILRTATRTQILSASSGSDDSNGVTLNGDVVTY